MSGHFAPAKLFSEGRGSTALPMPAGYFRLLLSRYGRSPGETKRVLEGTEISPERAIALDPGESILVWQQLRQVQNILASGRPTVVLDIAKALQGAAAHGDLAAGLATACDLKQSLMTLERFGHLRAPYFRICQETEEGGHVNRVEILPEVEPDLLRFLAETALVSFKGLIESAVGEAMTDARIEFPYSAPAYSQLYAKTFSAPTSFVPQPSRVSTLTIPLAWLDMQCPFASESQYRRAWSELEAAERLLDGESLIVARVEQVLERSVGTPPGAEEVARQLHLSRRTLVRRLTENGTSFRTVVDGHLRERAEKLLSDRTLMIAEIGHMLGYKDPANFGRAFRRWFGCSPNAHPVRQQSSKH